MKTVLSLLTRSMRLIGVLDAGREPDASQAEDGLESVIALYGEMIANGFFGPVTDVLITAAYTAKENERIIDATGLLTITLPLTVTDYDAYPDCSGVTPATRAVQDRAIVLVPGSTPKSWLFDSDLNAWTNVNALALADTAPLSGRFYNAMCALLALDLASEYGVAVPPKVQFDATQAVGALRRKRPIKVSAEFPLLRTLGNFWRGGC